MQSTSNNKKKAIEIAQELYQYDVTNMLTINEL